MRFPLKFGFISGLLVAFLLICLLFIPSDHSSSNRVTQGFERIIQQEGTVSLFDRNCFLTFSSDGSFHKYPILSGEVINGRWKSENGSNYVIVGNWTWQNGFCDYFGNSRQMKLTVHPGGSFQEMKTFSGPSRIYQTVFTVDSVAELPVSLTIVPRL